MDPYFAVIHDICFTQHPHSCHLLYYHFHNRIHGFKPILYDIHDFLSPTLPELDSHHMILKGLFHSHVFAYDDIRKLNFDIRATARRDPPLDIEFIDKDFTYHVFATDWIEKCCIDEIVEILKSKGIDTTNSIKFPW